VLEVVDLYVKALLKLKEQGGNVTSASILGLGEIAKLSITREFEKESF
jgi:hypothetical protein